MIRLILFLIALSLPMADSHAIEPTDINNISGKVLWLDATDYDSVVQSGGYVSNWADKSGNGNDAAQATASRQPAYVASAINGRPALHFLYASSVVDYLRVTDAASLNYTKNSIFVVMEPLNSSGSQFLVKEISGSTGFEYILARTASTFTFAGYYSTNGTSFNFPHTSDALTQDVGAIVDVQNGGNGGTWRLSINDNIAGVSSTSLGANLWNDTGNLYIGGNGASDSNPLVGYIGEVIIFNRLLTDYERRQVLLYLSGKWGIAL